MDATPAIALTAAFAILLTALGFAVSLRRVSAGATFGDAGDEVLRRRIRAHGNFTECAPMEVLAVWALGAAGVQPAWVWGMAAVFLGTRLMHAGGMLWSTGPGPRAAAMLAQHGAFLVTAGLIVRALA